jgi:PAS domain S-box-containing protein
MVDHVDDDHDLSARLAFLQRENQSLNQRLAELQAQTQRVETTLKESEAYNRMVFQDALRPIVIIDPATGIIDCNHAAVRMYGHRSRDTVLGRMPLDFSAPTQYDGTDSQTAASQQLRAIFKEGVSSFAWRAQRANGELWDAEVHLMAFDSGGKQLLRLTIDDVTEKRRALAEVHTQQAEIRKLLEEQQAIFENAPNGMSYTADGVILRANRRLAEYLGRTVEELIGRSAADILFASVESFQAFGRAVAPSLQEGKDVHIEWEFIKKDGSKFIAKVSGQGVRIPGHERVAVWVYEDIAARKSMENKIRQSEERLRRVLENSPAGVTISTEDGRAIFSNRRLAELLDTTPEHIAHIRATDFWYHPQDRQAFLNALRRDGGVKDYQATFVTVKGVPLTVLLSSVLLDLSDGRHLVTWIYDITERERSAEVARIASAEQSAMFEAATLGIAFLKDRVIIRSNARLDQMLGYAAGEQIGQRTRIWYTDDASDFDVGTAYQQLSRGEVHQREQELVRKDGSHVWCRMSGSAIDPQDLARGTVWMLEDISAARAAAADRARSEERVAKSEQRLNLALQGANLGLWDWYLDADGDITHVIINDIWAEMLGYTKQALEDAYPNHHACWVDLVHPDDRDGANQLLKAFLGNESSHYRSEYRMRAKSGDWKWILDIGHAAQRSPAGLPQRVVGIHQDISEHKEAEATLRDSEAYNKMLFQESSRSIVIIDPEYGCIDCNRAALHMYGYPSREHMLGKLPVDFSAPTQADGTDSRTALKMRGNTAPTGTNAIFEWRARRASGEVWDAEVHMMNFQHRGRTLMQFTVEDITERKRARAEIDCQQAKIRKLLDEQQAIFENAPNGIVYTGDGVILRANQRIAEHLGRHVDELIGQPGAILFESVAEYQAFGARVGPLLGAGKDAHLEWDFTRKDGSKFIAQISGQGLHMDGYNMVTVWVFEDIAERRAAEHATLHARQVAEDAARSKSDFLANMSHEIRTPMNAIIGMSHLALQTELAPRQRNYVEKVHRSAENLLGIINDILDFSKIEAGKLSLEHHPFRLEDVMDNLANLVGIKAEEKSLELLLHAGATVPMALVGDPLRLGQVLVNLGNNAVKFTESGEVVIGIDVVEQSAHQVLLHFWVRDTGIGMTPTQCERMFQSFSQADASITRKYGGTGLGLAICKNLVELMGGRIWVDSVAGQGSTFHFQVRFDLQSQNVATNPASTQGLAGVRILLVDDNASAREVLSAMTRSCGMSLDTASNGPQALGLIAAAEQAATPYDLVLLDWKMADMDGIETAWQLQSSQRTHAPVVIMVTAHGREEAQHAARQRGVTLHHVLTKPVLPTTLTRTLAQALGRHASDRPDTPDRQADYSNDMQLLGGARVLLVEDNLLNQELAVELLRAAGVTVEVVGNGQLALDALASDPHFDGVLMDCQMPVMDGYTATRELRQQSAFQNLPIIAMTANAMAGDREKALAAGMDDHIAKPLHLGEMFATLAKWIQPAKPATKPLPMAPLPDTTVLAELPVIEGVDTTAGLARTLGDAKFYRALLRMFRDCQRDFATNFHAARHGADPSAPERLAHTLKGSAGTICANRLFAAAADLEEACARGASSPEIASCLQATLDTLHPLLAAMDALDGDLQPSALDVPPVHSGAAQVQALVSQLEQLLAYGDASVAETIEANAATLSAAFPAHFQALRAAVDAFDFDQALAVLRDAITKST